MLGAKGLAGIDIGSKNIKAVQLKEVRGGYQLERFGYLPIPPELIVDGSILDSLRVVDVLKELVKKARLKVKDVVISVSGHSSVIVKRISLPEMSEEELSESIKFEAEQYVPFDIEDVNLDFQILGPREEPGQMDVLLVAVKKDKINEYVSVVREAGLNPVIVDADVFALENMYEINYEIEPGKNVALVNIGASAINMNILKGGVSAFTRDSSIGGNLHIEAFQKELNIPYESAERLVRGETVEGVSQKAAAPIITVASDDIIAEIMRSFDYFKGTTTHEDIHEIIISGGCALLEGFPSQLSTKTGIDVKVAEPFRNIQIPKDFDRESIMEIAPMAAVAVGLAIRRVGDR